MKEEEYPALYNVANNGAIRAQKQLLALTVWNSVLLVVGAVVTLINPDNRLVAIIAAFLFAASLFVLILGRFQQFQKKWYQARAMAESIKTSTWRFVMRADPFNEGTTAEAEFVKLLKGLLDQNRNLGGELEGGSSLSVQITERMLAIRNGTYTDRRSIYLEGRIDDQLKWYSGKVSYNKRLSKNWFTALCVVYALAVLLVLMRVGYPSLEHLPTGALLVLASSIISWMQLKKFDELVSAYALTAQEIGIVKSQYRAIADEGALSAFVSDAENVFSREHTQWAARKDH